MKGILLFGAGIAGMFVGAATMEVVHRLRPSLMKEIGGSTKRTFRLIGQAFREGYYEDPGKEKRLNGVDSDREVS